MIATKKNKKKMIVMIGLIFKINFDCAEYFCSRKL